MMVNMLDNPFLLLAELTAKSSIVLGLAFLAARLCRRFSAEERHVLWCSAVLGILALPVLPKPELGLDVAGYLPGTAAATVAGAAPAGDDGHAPATAAGPRLPVRSEARGAGMHWQEAAVALYAGVAAFLLAWLAVAYARIGRSLRRLDDVTHARTIALLEAAAKRNGLRRRLRAKWSSSDVTPLAWGFLRPLVVLPRDFLRLSPERQRNAIEHEVAHVARWDFLTTSLAWLCCAVYWFQPLAWLACRRMLRDSELACDDRVLSSGGCRRTYARQLLELARASGTAAPLGAAAMARKSSVSERITAILDPAKRRRTMTRWRALAIVGAATALLVPFNALTAKPGAPAAEAAGADRELRVRELAGAGREGEAAQLIAESIAADGVDGCGLCIETLAITRPGTDDEVTLRVVRRAFELVEQRARATGDGNLLIALAELCRRSGVESQLDRGTWYLMEGFRLGRLTDDSRLVALSLLNDLGWYEQARALAQALHEDPASSLYHSAETDFWITQLDRRLAHAKFVTGRLIAPHATAQIEGDVLPLYRQPPTYPPEALETGKEGEVLLGFTLSETGHPTDIRVLRSSDPVFEAPSVKSLSEWLFPPQLVAGVAVERPDQQVMLRYMLE